MRMKGTANTNLFGHQFEIGLRNKPKLSLSPRDLKLNNWKCSIKHINSQLEMEYDSFQSPKECVKYSMKNMLKELGSNKSLFTWQFGKGLLMELRKQENGHWTKRRIIVQILNRMVINHPYQTLILLISTVFVMIVLIWHRIQTFD